MGFEKAVDSLFIKPNTDIYITGSNAYMLSGELATLLSGRYITVDMLPLSFKEYCEAVDGNRKSTRENFNDYLHFGSFPYVAMLERNEAVITPYIDGIYNTILIKDVAKRELEPLEKIPDHYPKILLTLDEIGAGTNYNGIRHLNLIDWLLR